MAEVYFHMQSVPRRIGREEWYEIYHGVRLLRREVAVTNQAKADMLRRADIPDYIKNNIRDELIYPPLLLGPYMDRK